MQLPGNVILLHILNVFSPRRKLLGLLTMFYWDSGSLGFVETPTGPVHLGRLANYVTFQVRFVGRGRKELARQSKDENAGSSVGKEHFVWKRSLSSQNPGM